MDFKPGDLVRLKSGSALMTVETLGETMYSDDPHVFCVWTEVNGKNQVVKREPFPPVVLEHSSKPKMGTIKVGRA